MNQAIPFHYSAIIIIIIKIISRVYHLNHHGGGDGQQSQYSHACQRAHLHLFEDEEASPAQFLGRVRRVPHAVHSFHLQLLDQAASQVTQLVEAKLAMVAAHPAVACRRRHTLSFRPIESVTTDSL